MKILHLSYRIPYPANDGGAIAIANMIEGLYQNDVVIDLIAINTPKSGKNTIKINGVNKQHDVFVDTTISPYALLKSMFFKKTPYNVERFYSDRLNQKLEELLKKNSYDFILLESAFTTMYIPFIQKFTNAPIIVRTHNVETVIWERLAANETNKLKSWYFKHLSKRLLDFEKQTYNQADGIAAITEDDKQRLLKMGIQKPIVVVPVGMNVEAHQAKTVNAYTPQTIFSISSLDWAPNLEGLKWFLADIWPKLKSKKPEIEFHIAGKATPKWLLDLNDKNIVVHGFVDDAKAFQQNYQLMVVPLLSGSGMRVKIIEGFAHQKCIVSTTIGAEGIPYSKGENIVIADTVDQWVDSLVDLLEHPKKCEEIASNAYKLAVESFDNKMITKRMLTLFHQLEKKS